MQSFLHHWGYLALVVLTVAEAACIPIPSEVTVGYAGYLASTGRLNLAVIIVLATLGVAALPAAEPRTRLLTGRAGPP